MKPSYDEPPAPGALLEDDLSQFELQIAHRADELWLRDGRGRGSDIEFWLRAEREVVERRLSLAMGEVWQVT